MHAIFGRNTGAKATRTALKLSGIMLTSLVVLATSTASDVAFAQGIGCEGQSASGSQSLALASRLHKETLDKAKDAAGIGINPMFAGVSASVSRLEHDGYRLKQPVPQNGCADPAAPGSTPLTRLEGFETWSHTISALGEVDLTRAWRMPEGYTVRIGGAVGYKSLETETDDIISWLNGSTNFGPSRLEEDGVQFDGYALFTAGTVYSIVAGSVGFGNSDISYSALLSDVSGIGSVSGDTNYTDFTVSTTLGKVVSLAQRGNTRWVADVSGGLIYSAYNRDGFTTSDGGVFGDVDVNEFTGTAELKIAYQIIDPMSVVTIYAKGGVHHNFVYDHTFTTNNLGPIIGVPASQNFDVEQDNTFGVVGGGFAYNFDGDRATAVLDATYKGSGDSDEVIGKAQFIFKLN